ncbi:MAG TPA: FG-GAP-like repeat-containing protein, partial [Thermoanaerobaculia bacterium]|nr:FG-GAP-like repeat-containing protein [Thermoanaerobaculia bacterium]
MKNIILTLLALGVPVVSAGAPVFRNPLPVQTGVDQVGDLHKADFNGDGRNDVLLVHPGTELEPESDLVVLIANGTGPFAAPIVTPTPYSTYHAAVGDVNGDGKADVVLLDNSTATIGVMQGNGDGTFLPGFSFGSGLAISPFPLVLADFNGDNRLDIAVGTSDSHSVNTNVVVVYPGDGAGHFSGNVTTTIGDMAQDLTAADMNGDGKIDLIVGSSNANRIFLNDGTGSFTHATNLNSGGVVAADFNHDGKRDLAVADSGTHERYVYVASGNGDGTMATGVKYPAGYFAHLLDAADVNGDGNLDLLAPSAAGSTVAVLRGKADGTFHAPEFWISGPNAWNVVTDDFDRDGKLDFVTAGYHSNRGIVSFVRGNGNGTFQAQRAVHTPVVVGWPSRNLGVSGGITADVNGDDHADVVVVQKRAQTDSTDVGVLLNDGSGKLATPVVTFSGLSYVENPSFAVGDVNNDGHPDAVVLSSGTPPVANTLLGNGDGTFDSPIELDVANSGAVILGDFAGDASLDLFIPSGYYATLYPGNGSGTFGAGIRTDINNNSYVLTGDLNGDGKMDWIANANWTTDAYLNDGTGHFTRLAITDNERDAVALADFNGDQKLDLLFTTYTGTEIWFGNGNGTFGAPVSFTMQPAPYDPFGGPVTTADFDGDGKTDVAFDTTVYLGNGDGRFRSRAVFLTDDMVTAVHPADMDGNGSTDLVAVKGSADDVDVLLTRTTSDPTATSSVALSSDQATAKYGQPVIFTATVAGGAVPLAGAVAFAVDGQTQALIALAADGTAKFTTAFAIGSYAVTATYAGDENYLPSTKSMTQAVGKATPVATIFGGPSPRPSGQLVTISVALYGQQYPSFSGPTGALTLRDGDTPLNLTITNGKATTRTLSVGTHVISVDYPGDANYEPATASYTQVITKPVPTVVMGMTPSGPVVAGTQVTIRASFVQTTITGTISFYVNDVLHSTVPIVDSAAEMKMAFPWGYHLVRAVYSGDENWAISQNYLYCDVLIGPWGTPLAVDAVHSGGGSVNIQWARVAGAVSYTIWRKKSLIDGWEAVGTYGTTTTGLSSSMTANKTWLYAVTAT